MKPKTIAGALVLGTCLACSHVESGSRQACHARRFGPKIHGGGIETRLSCFNEDLATGAPVLQRGFALHPSLGGGARGSLTREEILELAEQAEVTSISMPEREQPL